MVKEVNAPVPRAGILEIQSYVPGRSAPARGLLPGVHKIYKLSSNETPLGPSPHALEVYHQACKKLETYPEGSSLKLREALGAYYGLDPSCLVCGNGSDDLIHLLASAYLNPGEEGIITAHGFLIYKIAILAAGGKVVCVPETKFTADVDHILAHITPQTRVVFLANPNNPTGTYLSSKELMRLHQGLPPYVLLVLDGAYTEYVTAPDYNDGIEWVKAYSNVVVIRTFSKIYGLASLRVGWCYAPRAICDVLHRIRGPFNVNGPAMETAIAALQDRAHTEKAVQHNSKELAWMSQEVRRLGLEVTPSVANFILVHFLPHTNYTAERAEHFLGEQGVIVRNVAAYGLPDALRVSVGSEEANRHFILILSRFLSSN